MLHCVAADVETLVVSGQDDETPEAMLFLYPAVSVRAVKIKISWEEWDYCFHSSFLEVLHFVKNI